jgi:hypothetical protein
VKSVSPRLGRDRGLWSRQPRWEAWRLPRYDDPSQRGQAAIIVVNDPLRVWFGRKTIATVDAGRAAAGAAVVTDSFLWRRRLPAPKENNAGRRNKYHTGRWSDQSPARSHPTITSLYRHIPRPEVATASVVHARIKRRQVCANRSISDPYNREKYLSVLTTLLCFQASKFPIALSRGSRSSPSCISRNYSTLALSPERPYLGPVGSVRAATALLTSRR